MRTSYNLVPVTPDDDDVIGLSPSGFRVYAAAAGKHVKVRTQAGDDVVLTYGVGVTVEALAVNKIYATGTDVADVTIHLITDAAAPV